VRASDNVEQARINLYRLQLAARGLAEQRRVHFPEASQDRITCIEMTLSDLRNSPRSLSRQALDGWPTDSQLSSTAKTAATD
jgi:hypothetical protein